MGKIVVILSLFLLMAISVAYSDENTKKISITGKLLSGTSDSAIETASGKSCGFGNNIPGARKIFNACNLDTKCKVSAIVVDDKDFGCIIRKVLSAKKL